MFLECICFLSAEQGATINCAHFEDAGLYCSPSKQNNTVSYMSNKD